MIIDYRRCQINFSFEHLLVIDAGYKFLYGSTNIPMDHREPNVRSPAFRVTKILCQTSAPEEKRKIIGDVFTKASRFQMSKAKSGLKLFFFKMKNKN